MMEDISAQLPCLDAGLSGWYSIPESFLDQDIRVPLRLLEPPLCSSHPLAWPVLLVPIQVSPESTLQ